jgi:flagellar hook protein FlgE
MLRAFASAVSGMRTQMAFMDVVANNIANVSTTGFKSSRARFSDMLYQTLTSGSASTDALGSVNPNQIGLGVRLAGIDTNVTQGALRATGNPLDIAIEGEGFFALKDASGSLVYTRDGAFGLDSQGRLVNPSNGMFVQAVGGGEITIDTKAYASFSIGPDGTITGTKADGSGTETIGQIGLTTFPNPAGLIKAGDNLWKTAAASGAATEGAPADAANGAGSLRSGVLEGSNVDLAAEFTNMIVAQRGFQASSRVISTADELLQDLVNIKR